MIFVTLTSSASLWTGVVNTFRCATQSNMTETESSWGCAAVGRSGSVSVDVNETTSGPTRWELDLDFPQFQLRFAIPTPDTVTELHDFLATGNADELTVGAISTLRLKIVRDNEFDDRFFLMMTSADDGALHWTLSGTNLTDLIAALADAVPELSD